MQSRSHNCALAASLCISTLATAQISKPPALADVSLACDAGAKTRLEPIYFSWKLTIKAEAQLRVSAPQTTEVQVWREDAWQSPYHVPGAPAPRPSVSRVGIGPWGYLLNPGDTLTGTVELVDLAVVNAPGRYRARACFGFAKSAPLLIGPGPKPRWLGLRRTDWVEFEVVPNERNSAVLAADPTGRVSSSKLARVLYAQAPLAAAITPGPNAEIEEQVGLRQPAIDLLRAGVSPGLAAKAHLIVAASELGRAARLGQEDGGPHVRSALAQLDAIAMPTGGAARSHLEPTIEFLRIAGMLGLDDPRAGARLTELCNSHRSFALDNAVLLDQLRQRITGR